LRSRADKLDLPLERAEQLVMRFLDDRGVKIRDLPAAADAVALSLEAARRFRRGRSRLNLADCFHYACARFYRTPILSTADEFRTTDLETVP
jgi:ribonuclease VapC